MCWPMQMCLGILLLGASGPGHDALRNVHHAPRHFSQPFVAVCIDDFLKFGAAGVTGFNIYSMLVAFIGAVVVLWIYHAFVGRRAL